MDRDRKLIFFIVGMGVLLIAIGLCLLLLYKLYGEDVKEIRPVVVIGIHMNERYLVETLLFCLLRSVSSGCGGNVPLPLG